MTISQQFPELNSNQIKQLHRLVVGCMPDKGKLDGYIATKDKIIANPQQLKYLNMGRNHAIDQAHAALDVLFGVDELTQAIKDMKV